MRGVSWISVDTLSLIAWREGLTLTEALDPLAKQTGDVPPSESFES
jgi:hypothetical protein